MIRFWNKGDGDHMLNEGMKKFDVIEMKMTIDCKKNQNGETYIFL